MTAGERVRAGIIVIGVIEMAALGISSEMMCETERGGPEGGRRGGEYA